MATFRALTAVVFSALLLTACFDNNSRNDGSTDGSTDNAFTSFVEGLFENTSDTAEPVSINDREFNLDGQDETAFNDLIQQQ